MVRAVRAGAAGGDGLRRPGGGVGCARPRDFVQDGVTGALVPPRDPGKLAQVLTGLLSDPERSRYGAAADRACERYARPRISRRITAIYRQVQQG